MRFMPLALLLVAIACPAAEQAAPIDPSGSWSGRYIWLDMPDENYEGKTISLTLTPSERGHEAVLVASFRSKVMKGRFAELGDHHYRGSIAGDPAAGPIAGTVASDRNDQRWNLDLKFLGDDRCVGMAREIEGYGTWAVFELQRDDEASAPEAADDADGDPDPEAGE